MFTGVLDAPTALAKMMHEYIAIATLAREVPVGCVTAMFKDYHCKIATIELPPAGSSEPFKFQRCGWQGGTRTPDEFNLLMTHTVDDIAGFWEQASKRAQAHTQAR